ncbi:MAG: glycosyltransferase [Gemmatimonadetes bacterium]|nr:MAG: glycosyltransferase [Gemmatimonadota bacterium]
MLYLGKGGMESTAINLARGLDRTRFRPVIIALDEAGEHEEELREAGIEYHVLGGRRLRDPRFHWRLFQLLRRLRPDVVHTHHFATLLHTVTAARLARVPRLVHTEHSWQYLEHRSDYRRALRWMSRLSDVFVVVGNAMAPYYRDHVRVAAGRLRVIANGIDVDVYRPVTNVAAARRTRGLPTGVTVGTAGRLFPEKDYGILVRAVAGLILSHPDLHLIMIGDGPERPALEALAVQLGVADHVRFLGWRSDVADLLPLLDVFVLSSLREGLPLAVLEAMACGVPVVTTPVGDLPEVIVEGRAGFFFPIGNPDALAAVLRRLVAAGAERHAIGRAGRQRVAERYSLREMVNAYAGAYDG